MKERGEWGSKVGFILAASGSAIGLGNIWRFPYITGENGGGAFVFVYIICVVLICLPYMFAEFVLGRETHRNPIGAFKVIKPHSPWMIGGALGVLASLFIISYYSVIAGWSFGYIFKSAIGNQMPFKEFVATPSLVIPLYIIFILITAFIVHKGIKGGIEKMSKVLMPILFFLILIMIIRSVTLPGAIKGIQFYLYPDFSKITSKIILLAMAQALFSLSLGQGIMITYASYLGKDANMVQAGCFVAFFDTLVAFMAGLMIFPAIFAFGMNPEAGPTLVFTVLPHLFAQMPMGHFFATIFFILFSITALTTTISFLEVVVSYLVDEKDIRRNLAVWIVAGFAIVLGIPSALSQGACPWLSNLPIFGGIDFLDMMDFFWVNIVVTMGALIISIFVGHVWGATKAAKAIEEGSPVFAGKFLCFDFTVGTVWTYFIRYVCPIVIAVVLFDSVFRL